MKPICHVLVVLLLATQVNAETYSWVDDNGTYNFTEDYSTVPKKYRKKVKRREDYQQDQKPSVAPESAAAKQGDKAAVKPSSTVQDEDKGLYGGKSRDVWRKDLEAMETDLRRIEQRMEQLRKQLSETKGMTQVRYDLLKKEYDDNLAVFEKKYKKYDELIEAARKAGIAVEMKK